MRRSALLSCALYCALSLGMFAQVARAQAPATGPAAPATDARDLFRRGEAAYSAGNYELAIREWNSAYTADPRPRIQFNLSQAYERLGELEKAMDALKRFLDSGDPDDPMYSDANARLSALQQRIGLTGVIVRGGHEGGSILVDDQDWGRTPRPDKIALSPGSHVLVVRWADRPEYRANLAVPAGQVIEVNLPDDNGAKTAEPVGPVVASTNTQSDGPRLKPMHWYAIGGGVAALGVGALVYGIVRGQADADCKGATYCDPDDEDAASRQSLAGYITGGVLIAGGVGLAVVGYLQSRASGGVEKQARTTCGVGLASASCLIRF